MSKQNVRLAIAIVSMIFLNSGCQFAGESPEVKPAPALPPVPPIAEGWVTERDENPGLASLTVAKISDPLREQVRRDLTRNELLWMNSKTGYSVYKVQGSETLARSAFILPKVFVIGSLEGGRASIQELPEGKASLTIPLALIDGSRPELIYATHRVAIPDSLYLDENKLKTLQQELTARFGYPHTLSMLGVCPKSIVLKVAGEEWDVTPRVFLGPGGPSGCQANQPFTVTLIGSKRYLARFLSDDVFNGAVEIAVSYEVAGTFVDEVRVYELHAASLYLQLKSQLVSRTERGDETKVIRAEEADRLMLPWVEHALSRWATQERHYERLKTEAVAQLKALFFSEVPPAQIGDESSALRLKNEVGLHLDSITLRMVNERFARQGEVYYSSSIVHPMSHSIGISLRGEEREDLGQPPRTGIAQDVLTVGPDEEFELRFQSLGIHEYEFGERYQRPEIRDQGLVCLDQPGEGVAACRKIQTQCRETKSFCKKPKIGCRRFAERMDCDTQFRLSPVGCLTLGLFGNCGVERVCQPVEDRDRCIEYGELGCEEIGVYCSQTQQICEPGFEEPLCRQQITDLRITKYFTAPAPVNYREIEEPCGKSDQDPISGITLRFKWPDGKVVDCLLMSLLTSFEGQTVRFQVKNTPSCQPFSPGQEGRPLLSIVNRISSLRKEIPCGIMNYSTVEGAKYYGCNHFDAIAPLPDQHQPGRFMTLGSYSRVPLTLTYYPVVDLNVVLSSRSNSFTSTETREGEVKK